MTGHKPDITSFCLSRSVTDNFHGAFIAADSGNAPLARAYHDMAQKSLRKLAAHLGFELVPVTTSEQKEAA